MDLRRECDIFEKNSFVQISSDLELIKQLQNDHDEWKNTMNEIIEKIGRVIHIYDDGNVLVEVKEKKWTLNNLILKKNNNLNFDKNSKSDIFEGLKF